MALQRHDEAVVAYEKGLGKDPSNKGIKAGGEGATRRPRLESTTTTPGLFKR